MFLSVIEKNNSPLSVEGCLACGTSFVFLFFFLKKNKMSPKSLADPGRDLGTSAVEARTRLGSSRWRRRARTWPPERCSPLRWSERNRLKGKRGKSDDWITSTRLFAYRRKCRRSLVWGTFSFGHGPAREITIFGGAGRGGGGGTQALLQCGRELPTRTADRGLFYSVLVCCCACTYVSFQSSPSFLFSLGWGLKTGGGSYSHKDRR